MDEIKKRKDSVASISSDCSFDRIDKGGLGEEREAASGNHREGLGNSLHGEKLHRAVHRIGVA